MLRVSEGAREWLEQQLHVTNVRDLKGRSLKEVRETLASVARSSDEQLYVALSTAYALFVELSEADAHPLLISMAKAVGRPLVRKDTLRIIVEALIPYGQAGTGDAGAWDKRAAQQLHSRDVRAISFLIKSGVSPADVVDKAKRKGQGVVAWAGSMARLRNPRPAAPSKAIASRVYRVVWTRPSGTKIPMSFDVTNEKQNTTLEAALKMLWTLSRGFERIGASG